MFFCKFPDFGWTDSLWELQRRYVALRIGLELYSFIVVYVDIWIQA